MGLEYFPCYHSYGKKCEKLTDQELGRLFRALFRYSETGERQELAGRESIAFDFIADDIDRAKEAYEAKCEKNRANASERKRTVANGSQTSQSKYKDKTKTKEKTKSEKNNPPVSPQGETDLSAFGQELQDRIREWLQYKREKGQGYKPTGLTQFLSKIKTAADQYGEKAVCEAITTSETNNWQGVFFDRLERRQDRGHTGNVPAGNPGRNWGDIKGIPLD